MKIPKTGTMRYICHSELGKREDRCPRLQKGGYAIHRKMNKCMFGKQRFLGPHRNNGTQKTLMKPALLGSSASDILSSYYYVVIYGDSSFLGAGPLLKFFSAGVER